MSAAVTTTGLVAVGDAAVAKLWLAIDPGFLRLLQWRDDRGVLVFPARHALLGWNPCRAHGCGKDAKLSSNGLCQVCHLRWRSTGCKPLDKFVGEPKPVSRCIGVSLCIVDGCERP